MAKTTTQKTTTRRPRKATAQVPTAAPEAAVPLASDTPKPPRGKLGAVVELLSRPEGASIEAIANATGWQAHSVRGAMSGSLKKKHGLKIVSEATDTGRIYRVASEASA
jgi:hypothetical protein